jgi:hypothetical protein
LDISNLLSLLRWGFQADPIGFPDLFLGMLYDRNRYGDLGQWPSLELVESVASASEINPYEVPQTWTPF